MICSYLSLTAAVAATTAGQLYFKHYHRTQRRLYFLLAIGFFLVVPAFNYSALRGIPMDIVYMATSVTILLAVLGSNLLFGEFIPQNSKIGLLFILGGILIYNT